MITLDMVCIGPILVDLFWNTTFILLYLSRFLSWLLAWHWRGMGGIFWFTIIIIVTLDVGEGYMSSFILYLPLIQSYIQDSTSIKSFLFTKYLKKNVQNFNIPTDSGRRVNRNPQKWFLLNIISRSKEVLAGVSIFSCSDQLPVCLMRWSKAIWKSEKLRSIRRISLLPIYVGVGEN